MIDARSGRRIRRGLPARRDQSSGAQQRERARVGTVNKVESPFAAKRVARAAGGAQCRRHDRKHFADKPKDWAPLVYLLAWRQTIRHADLSAARDRLRRPQLAGGYKAFRGRVNDELPALAARYRYFTICGCTGTGKTALLAALASVGAQVIDLEGLANHRGSLLGARDTPQPSQKRFDTPALERAAYAGPDAAGLRRVGKQEDRPGADAGCDAQQDGRWRMRVAGRAAHARVAHIASEYAHFVADPQALMENCSRCASCAGEAATRVAAVGRPARNRCAVRVADG